MRGPVHWSNADSGLGGSRRLLSDLEAKGSQRRGCLQLHDPKDQRCSAVLAYVGVVFDAQFDDIFEDRFPGFMVCNLLSVMGLVGGNMRTMDHTPKALCNARGGDR